VSSQTFIQQHEEPAAEVLMDNVMTPPPTPTPTNDQTTATTTTTTTTEQVEIKLWIDNRYDDYIIFLINSLSLIVNQ